MSDWKENMMLHSKEAAETGDRQHWGSYLREDGTWFEIFVLAEKRDEKTK